MGTPAYFLKLCVCLLALARGAFSASVEHHIASFNVQTFGQTFMSDPEEVAVVVKIIRRYELMLFMEVRDISGTAIVELQTEVNADSSNYTIAVGPREGRTSSKEQYTFFYKADRVSLLKMYEYPDSGDVFERPPIIALWKTDGLNFATIGIHTKPTDAPAEIDALADVYDYVVKAEGLSSALILGDFNAGCSYVSEKDWASIRLRTESRFQWLIGDTVDTTTKSNCPYDRFVCAGALCSSISAKSAQPFLFDKAYGLSPEFTEKVSDHYPIELVLVTAVANLETTDGNVAARVPNPTGSSLPPALVAAAVVAIILVMAATIVVRWGRKQAPAAVASYGSLDSSV